MIIMIKDDIDVRLNTNKEKFVDNYGYTDHDNDLHDSFLHADGNSVSFSLFDMPQWMAAFLDELPKDLYDVFDPKSFHITVRALRA
ncbi:hypothetical protein RFI_33470 [Reticulomyxa filosa]|uniref:Uncharacterized protein n=1 Tax=Reticulomyxa filosa TaxID=46433 RepID=X6LS52_RETFI|nr:hypothetical protein RFI_33470 [Reticulomyxa filosa]|eukprot:ETO03932.1 hypothetical protein RFI_33470 [Reticulomyxa filosa]